MSDPIVTDVDASHKSPSLIDYFDRPIAFHRPYAVLAGSAAGGLMLSQAVYDETAQAVQTVDAEEHAKGVIARALPDAVSGTARHRRRRSGRAAVMGVTGAEHPERQA